MATENLNSILELLDDPKVDTVYVNGSSGVYLEKEESFERSEIELSDAGAVKSMISELGQQVGRTLSGDEEVVDIRLADGKRVSAFNPPEASSPVISIRK